MRRLPLLISVPFPGLGHILLRHFFLGIFIGLSFYISLGALLSSFIWPAVFYQRLYFGLVALCIWLYAILDNLRLLRKETLWQKESETLYRGALEKYLQGKYEDSLRNLRRLLWLKSSDLEARLLIAEIYRQTGKISQAKRALKKIRRLDEQDKWRWEVEEALSRLKAK
jgi:tetratricopeptide (TPR) repeat protein